MPIKYKDKDGAIVISDPVFGDVLTINLAFGDAAAQKIIAQSLVVDFKKIQDQFGLDAFVAAICKIAERNTPNI